MSSRSTATNSPPSLTWSYQNGTFLPPLHKLSLSLCLKKHNPSKQDLSSYRPISNLNVISKILEGIIHDRLCTHLNSFPFLTPFQSAYRRLHSTESALLKIQNDLLLSINQQETSALILLDFSAAFDTIDHKILLTWLSSAFTASQTRPLTFYLPICLIALYLSL